MASLVPTIKDKEFQNWLRGALALLFAKQGLDDFVLDEITQFQRDVLAFIFTKNHIPAGTVCNTCTTENVLPCPTQNFCPKGRRCNLHNPARPDKSPGKICPNNICHGIREAIRHEHRYNGPSWKNTDASRWCTNAIDIAKCYMAPDGYSAVSTFADTDFNGVLAVIINNKRFQNKMASQLHQQINVCTEAREVGRVVRHSADLSITDTDLAKYIDTLIDLLSDPKYLATDQNAQVAVNKLIQLKSSTLTITTADIILAMDNTLKDIVTKQNESIDVKKDEAEGVIEEKTNESLKLLCDFKDSIANTQTLILNQIAATKVSVVREIENVSKIEKKAVSAMGSYERRLFNEEIKSVSEKEKQKLSAAGAEERDLVSTEIKNVSEKEKEELRTIGVKERQLMGEQFRKCYEMLQQLTSVVHVSTVSMAQEVLKNCLRQGLITFYRTYHSAITFFNDVPLVDCYIQPVLTSVGITSRQVEESQVGLPVHSYRNLFFSGNGNLYKNIYITANAGFGKTSFSKRICMAWCQAHNKFQGYERKFHQEDIEVMKQFDFLFFLTLRNVDLCSCEVDDMIYKQIINSLEGSHLYTEYFVRDVLRDMSCLIVLDGLDEWIPPEFCKKHRNVHEIPHRPAWKRCSVVTTTRPWKLNIANVIPKQIDMQVEITYSTGNTRQLLMQIIKGAAHVFEA